MANTEVENRLIRTHRNRARDWLLGWGERHAEEVHSIDEPKHQQLLYIALPNGRQVVFHAPMDQARAHLFMFCSLRKEAPKWPHGCPAHLLNWLSDGMRVAPTRVFYSPVQNFLIVGLPLELDDWGQAMEVSLPMVSIVLAYLTRVRAYVMEANGLSSLDCPEAIQLRQWFQDELRAYPILLDVADPAILNSLTPRRYASGIN